MEVDYDRARDLGQGKDDDHHHHPHHIRELEKKIMGLMDAQAHLGRATSLADLLRIIRQPGWTTPAELAFLTASLDHIGGAVRSLGQFEDAILAAADKVAVQG